MRVAVTGGSGRVGRFIVAHLLARGDSVVVLSRREDRAPTGAEHRFYDLGAEVDPPLGDAEALVHAALDHVPGRYRGGEGADAAGFRERNLGGTLRLFDVARRRGVGRVVLISTRAVYGDQPPGTTLHETTIPRPDTLYGQVKREGEIALEPLIAAGIGAAALRVTGVYGLEPEGGDSKWSALFRRFVAGAPVAPRIGTEVHGDDVAAAVAIALDRGLRGVLNVSDIVLDRADLLERFSRLTGVSGCLPERADPASINVMATDRLRGLGWRPRGMPGLDAALAEICAPWHAAGEGHRP